MAVLVAIGYPDETSARRAAVIAAQLADELLLPADAFATIVRDREGNYHATTNHSPVDAGATWGMFWGVLFSWLLFVPVLGMFVGARLRALLGVVEAAGIDAAFQRQVRDMLQPGTSALFLMIDEASSEKAVDALSSNTGTVLSSALSAEGEAGLQRELHDATAGV